MDVTRIVLAPLVLLAGLLAIGWPNYYEALQRSKQQRTMAGMRDLAIRIEARQPYTITDDGWGHPMRVHVAFTPGEATRVPTGVVVDVLRATSTIVQALDAG